MNDFTRYAPDRSGLNMEQHSDGLYVLHSDVVDAVANATAPGRTDAQVVEQTEMLAASLARFDGFHNKGCFRNSTNPRVLQYWHRACIAQEILTRTDPNDAVTSIDESEGFSVDEKDGQHNFSPEYTVSTFAETDAFEIRVREAVEKAEAPLQERIGQLEVEIKKARINLQDARSLALEEAASACAIDSQTSTTRQFELGVEWCALAVRELKGIPPA